MRNFLRTVVASFFTIPRFGPVSRDLKTCKVKYSQQNLHTSLKVTGLNQALLNIRALRSNQHNPCVYVTWILRGKGSYLPMNLHRARVSTTQV